MMSNDPNTVTVLVAKPMISIDSLASKLVGRVNVVIGYRSIIEDEVQELMFNNSRMVNNRIPALARDTAVTEICICSSQDEVRVIQRILGELNIDRPHKQWVARLADGGKAWTFAFKD